MSMSCKCSEDGGLCGYHHEKARIYAKAAITSMVERVRAQGPMESDAALHEIENMTAREIPTP